MKTERWKQINEVLLCALDREAAERSRFIKDASGSDEELRREVVSLLASYEQAGAFLEDPVTKAAARLLADDSTHLVAGQQINHYKVVSLLGSGGMGDVYLVRDTRLGRQAAIKLLPPRFTQDRDRLRRFQHEARAASALNHPNIITIYEVGKFDSAQYLVTEFIDGETLLQYMKDSRSRVVREKSPGPGMALSEVLDISIQLAGALGAAHSASIVHRDIKPANIMVRRDGYVKVLDFGVAKLTEHFPALEYPGNELSEGDLLATKPGEVVGTTSYMSPEQARGLAVESRTDIWSAGVVLYEMITGNRPFKGPTRSDVISSILRTEPISLAGSSPYLPAELERIVMKALRKSRDERYQTAQDLAFDLKRVRQQLEFEARLERELTPIKDGEADATVFVVDDDESIREALKSLISSVGLQVATFASAREFLQSSPPDAPGCLVLDVRLPGLSGLDLQRELAKANVATPIIFITGHADIPMTVSAMKAGAVEFLSKPFRDQDLLDAIQQALERDRMSREQRVQESELPGYARFQRAGLRKAHGGK
jgi:serine/threonine protein kinase